MKLMPVIFLFVTSLSLILFFNVTAKKNVANKMKVDGKIQQVTIEDSLDTAINYTQAKANTKNLWLKLKAKPNTTTKTLEDSFYQAFYKTLLPYWYGTPWDFNGITTTPGQGNIACGYFVTTLLQDAGIPLQRVKLAQLGSEQIIHKLISNKYCKNYTGQSFDNFIKAVNQKGKGIYMVGLDFHVGFLLHDGKTLYFIHSNYINRKGVVKEKATESAALKVSKWHYVGYLTHDPNFLKSLIK